MTSVDTYLDSNLQSVDSAEKMVLDVAQEAGFPEEDLHKISMAVRETIVNAVVHGNRYSSHKKVHLRASRTPEGLAVTVVDEGNGFDLSSLPDPLAEENLLHQSGRGILLIRAFVDDFQMRRLSPGGTEVRLVKRLTQKS
ncbi:MAG: ATP-binding protein [Planctomycetota bacterium]